MSVNALGLGWQRLRGKGNIKASISMTYATKLSHGSLKKDVNVPEVALISRHKNVRILFRYTQSTNLLILLFYTI